MRSVACTRASGLTTEGKDRARKQTETAPLIQGSGVTTSALDKAACEPAWQARTLFYPSHLFCRFRSYDKSIVASPSSSPSTAQHNIEHRSPAFSPASSSGSGGSSMLAQLHQQPSSSSLRTLAPKGTPARPAISPRATLAHSPLQAFLSRRPQAQRCAPPPPPPAALAPPLLSLQVPVAARAHRARARFRQHRRRCGPRRLRTRRAPGTSGRADAAVDQRRHQLRGLIMLAQSKHFDLCSCAA